MLLGGAVRAGEADAEKQIDAIIKKAVELRRQGKDREALTELQRAAAIGGSPRLSAQTGLAEQALGLWPGAEKHLREGLDHGGDAWIKKNRRALEEALAVVGGHLATLEVWGTPEGAEVLINGDLAGTLPLSGPLRIEAESTQLVVRAKGFVQSARTLDVSAGAKLREHVVLLAADVRPPPPAAPAVAEAAPMITAPAPAAAADEHPSVLHRWWFWTLAAVVVAGGATALALSLRNGSAGGCAPNATTTCSTW